MIQCIAKHKLRKVFELILFTMHYTATYVLLPLLIFKSVKTDLICTSNYRHSLSYLFTSEYANKPKFASFIILCLVSHMWKFLTYNIQTGWVMYPKIHTIEWSVFADLVTISNHRSKICSSVSLSRLFHRNNLQVFTNLLVCTNSCINYICYFKTCVFLFAIQYHIY